MKIQYIVACFFALSLSFAQSNDDFNKWSVEVNAGQSKGITPFTENYYSSNPKDYFNITNVNHYDLGFRYMFNQYFGTKLDFGYDTFKNEEGSGSLPFESKFYSVSIQGVINLTNVLHFNTFTKRFGLLVHGGLKVSQFSPSFGVHKEVTEDNGGVVIGFTPQFRISNRFAATLDYSTLTNLRQHYNWDGAALSNRDNNLTGKMSTVSLGITYYIGRKADVHADWYYDSVQEVKKAKVDDEARKRLDELETMLQDTDKDGIADYLDFENNTPGGVAVDSRGRFVDVNGNSVPDELEGGKVIPGSNGVNGTSTNGGFAGNASNVNYDAIKSLVENEYVNIFFDLNSHIPSQSSSNNLLVILNFMKKYPASKIQLIGYADSRGGAELNKNLSSKRSTFVLNYLVKNGIDANRISTEARGVDATYSSDSKEIDFRMARRVTVILVKE